MKMLKIEKIIRAYFGFTLTETRGFLVLLLFMVLLLTIPQILKNTIDVPKYFSEEDNKKLLVIMQDLEENHKKDIKDRQEKFIDNKKIQLFTFNPNTASITDLQNLGFYEKLAQRLINYREKGGKFYKKEDLKKIYGFPENLYNRLENYIVLEAQNSPSLVHTEQKERENTPIKYPEKLNSFDINLVDTSQLVKIKGIGSVLAQRIIKFRDNLGGFHSLEQIREVYGLSADVQEEILKYAQLGTYPKKININTSDFKHPYIKPYQAKDIVSYRNQHGNFKSIDDLLKIKSLDEQWLVKVRPYLEL